MSKAESKKGIIKLAERVSCGDEGAVASTVIGKH